MPFDVIFAVHDDVVCGQVAVRDQEWGVFKGSMNDSRHQCSLEEAISNLQLRHLTDAGANNLTVDGLNQVLAGGGSSTY